jgi:hypothetical protein
MKCFEQSKSSLKNEIMYLYQIAKNQNDFYQNLSKTNKKPSAHERGNWLAHGEYMRRLEGIMDRHGIK